MLHKGYFCLGNVRGWSKYYFKFYPFCLLKVDELIVCLLLLTRFARTSIAKQNAARAQQFA